MLKTILSISGKPGLYKLISQGKNMLIVESLVDKKRFPAYGNEKIISLGDIAMYTDAEEVPLKDVLLSMKKKENGAAVALDVKKASVKELQAYLAEVLPNFDRDRVYVSDIKKLISWYNLLVASGMTDFEEASEAVAEETKEATAEYLYSILRFKKERCMRGRFSYTFLFKSDWLSVSEHQSVFRSIGIHRNRFAAVNLLRQQLLGQVVQ